MDKKPIDKIPLKPIEKMPIKPIDKAAIDKAASEHIDRLKDIRFQRKQKLKYIKQYGKQVNTSNIKKKSEILVDFALLCFLFSPLSIQLPLL